MPCATGKAGGDGETTRGCRGEDGARRKEKRENRTGDEEGKEGTIEQRDNLSGHRRGTEHCKGNASMPQMLNPPLGG